MKRILGLVFALLCAGWAYAPRAEAQCGAYCQTILDLETGQQVGYACVVSTENTSRCTTTATRCSLSPCGGSALILDSKGTALASAKLCGGEVREVRQITVIRPEPRTAPESVAGTAGSQKPLNSRSEVATPSAAE